MCKPKSCILAMTFMMVASPPTSIGESLPNPSLENQTIIVIVYNYAKVGENQLKKAQGIAGRIYRNADIKIRWQQGPTPIGIPFADRNAIDQQRLYLRIKPTSPSRWLGSEGVCGEAIPRADIADIFFDRVENKTWEIMRIGDTIFHRFTPPTMCASLILGVVMAHELGHLMLGIDSHSGNGIMRASWNWQDLQNAYLEGANFTPEQVEQLHVNLQGRTEAQMVTQVFTRRSSRHRNIEQRFRWG